MRINDIINEQVLTRHEIGFGLTQLSGDNYSLVGGSRSGSSSAGETRLRYSIIDHKTYEETDDFDKSTLGFVELFVQDGTNKIVGLVNIKLNQKKAGLGSKIVSDIVDTAGGELRIHDIQNKARGFWNKQGVEYVDTRKSHGVIRR
jgi:hypothetical protein